MDLTINTFSTSLLYPRDEGFLKDLLQRSRHKINLPLKRYLFGFAIIVIIETIFDLLFSLILLITIISRQRTLVKIILLFASFLYNHLPTQALGLHQQSFLTHDINQSHCLSIAKEQITLHISIGIRSDQSYFENGQFPPSFYLFSSFKLTVYSKNLFKFASQNFELKFPPPCVTLFEPRIFGVGSNHCTTCVTIMAQ